MKPYPLAVMTITRFRPIDVRYRDWVHDLMRRLLYPHVHDPPRQYGSKIYKNRKKYPAITNNWKLRYPRFRDSPSFTIWLSHLPHLNCIVLLRIHWYLLQFPVRPSGPSRSVFYEFDCPIVPYNYIFTFLKSNSAFLTFEKYITFFF